MRVAAMAEMITRRPAPGQPTPALGARSGSIVAPPPYEDAEALIHQYATTGVPVGDPGAHGEPVREPDHARLMR
jgi:hypothetical protein